jgi:5'(3')-deoxyribonucleotidase
MENLLELEEREMFKFKILVDLDETICKFLDPLCLEYNRLCNANLKSSQIDSWELNKFMGDKGVEIFSKKGFFDNLSPFPNAIKIMELLNKEYEIIIASRPQNIDTSVDKYIWIEKYMPFLNFNQITLTSHKELLKADIMIDDCGYYLEEFKKNCDGSTICIDRPYNAEYKVDHRIYQNNWFAIYDLIKGIEVNR